MERAEDAFYSYIQDEMTTFGTLPATLEESGNPTEKTEPEDDKDEEKEQSLSDSHENMGHPSNRTLIRALRLGGAKLRFELTAAKQ